MLKSYHHLANSKYIGFVSISISMILPAIMQSRYTVMHAALERGFIGKAIM